MKAYDGVSCYYYDEDIYKGLNADQRIGLDIWCQNGKHFRIFCAAYNTLEHLMDDLTDIIGESSYNYVFIANGEVFNEDAKLGNLRVYGNFGCIKITAIKRPDPSYGGPKNDKIVECFVQYGMMGFSSGFLVSKTLEDYEIVIRFHLAIRKLKHYGFVDYQGHPINPKRSIGSIPSCGPTRIITIKDAEPLLDQIKEAAKKTQELLEQAPKDETN